MANRISVDLPEPGFPVIQNIGLNSFASSLSHLVKGTLSLKSHPKLSLCLWETWWILDLASASFRLSRQSKPC